MYAAPQTPDGWIEEAQEGAEGRWRIEVAIPLPAELRDRARGRESELVFAARSRLARLGINVMPAGEFDLGGAHVRFAADVEATVRSYGIGPWLPKLLVPGLRVGRLVFCPRESRLSSEAVDALVQSHHVQLPRNYSIDGDGRFRIRPDRWVYELHAPPTLEALRTILMREGGKETLNRIQFRRAVRRVALEPHDGVITSCSMFLHRHYVVLESAATSLGQHLEAVVLDPIATRGMNIFLEFYNNSDRRIVNPTVAASIYEAMPEVAPPRFWHGTDFELPAVPQELPEPEREYRPLAALFDRLEGAVSEERYSHRLVAVVEDLEATLGGAPPLAIWQHPPNDQPAAWGPDMAAPPQHGRGSASAWRAPLGTSILADVPRGAGTTLMLGYFPNLVEHTQICAAAIEGKVRKIVFRRASFEHGAYFSSRDHGRLADYDGLGIDVYWCHDGRRHVAQHVFRGLRGFFLEPRLADRFRSALIFAAYGSARPLSDEQVARMEKLVRNLRLFFGPDIAFMTGGGPGAMRQVTDLAQSMGLLAGASFIETVDQATNKTADFYQTFQSRSRQARQRWFEIASFHLFFMGGVGTLEEVGLTLTDMKLGVIELSPLVFFGRHESEHYWRRQLEQFATMVQAGRAPDWLATHVIATDDPADVLPFYERLLELA